MRENEQVDQRVARCIHPDFKVVLNDSAYACHKVIEHCFFIVFLVVDDGGGSGGRGGGGGTHGVEMILNRGKKYAHASLTHLLAPRCSLYLRAPLRSFTRLHIHSRDHGREVSVF